jgi:hypothetical protein
MAALLCRWLVVLLTTVCVHALYNESNVVGAPEEERGWASSLGGTLGISLRRSGGLGGTQSRQDRSAMAPNIGAFQSARGRSLAGTDVASVCGGLSSNCKKKGCEKMLTTYTKLSDCETFCYVRLFGNSFDFHVCVSLSHASWPRLTVYANGPYTESDDMVATHDYTPPSLTSTFLLQCCLSFSSCAPLPRPPHHCTQML